MKKFERKRYEIKAKRKDRVEPWSAWTEADNYNRAVHHSVHVEELGYRSKIVVDSEVKALWDILGTSFEATEKTDEILGAGFRLTPVLAKEIFVEINKQLDFLIQKTEIELEVCEEKKRKTHKLVRLMQELASFNKVKKLLNDLESTYTEGDADDGSKQ